MLSDDQAYLSWMARTALAVLMTIVMIWIRGQMPDDVDHSDLDQTAEEAAPTDSLSLLRTAHLDLLPASVQKDAVHL